MKKLKNMKVKRRLITSFIFVVLLASVAGLLGAGLLIAVDIRYSSAMELNGFIQGDLGEYSTNLNRSAGYLRDMILLEDEASIAEAKASMTEADEKVDQYLHEFETKLETEDEKALLADIKAEYPEYLTIREEVIALSEQNASEEALEKFQNEALPHLEKIVQDTDNLITMNAQRGDEVTAELTSLSIIFVVITVVYLVIAIAVAMKFAVTTANDFVRPLEEVQGGTEKLAKGELDVHIQVNSKNEFGEMADNLNAAIAKLREYIEVIEYGLDEVGKGNFAVRPTVEFQGKFIKLKDAIQNIIVSLSRTMNQINEGADSVAVNAENLAQNSQVLAEGASNQAASVEELTATIEDVAESAKDSAQKAKNAYQDAEKLADVARTSSDEMKRLTEAMERITATSNEIEKIIAEIEDIAAQTNLLALNASIEAARAGEAGRGFAVVADQIGKLASDSAQSAVNTRDLIAKSLAEITQGNEITTKTAEALEQVMGGIQSLADVSKGTSVLSAEQAETMVQIQVGIEQIASVVQNNAAAAEESSATSEELSAQSQNLKALVDQFVLWEECL